MKIKSLQKSSMYWVSVKICFMMVTVLSCSCTVVAEGETNSLRRLAILSSKEIQKSGLADLLTIQLQKLPGIELVERAEIDKILDEQQLSLAGLLQRNSIIKVGQLLRADAFLLLSVEDGGKQKENEDSLLRIRFIETAHGLRLLDSFEELDGATIKESMERIFEKVAALVPKITLPPGKAIPVGIVDIHRVQLGERYQWLARSLVSMLSVRLSKESQIIMLEREDLKVLHDEKLLTEGEDAQFWNSAVLIDGHLQPKGTKDVEMKLRLRQAGGKKICALTVLVHPKEPLAAVDKAATSIIEELLNGAPSTPWQPKQEAEEFYRQGELLKNHKRHKEALTLLETAHALQPENFFYTGALFENEWQARYLEDHKYRVTETGVKICSDSELVDLVSLLVHQFQKELQTDSLRESLHGTQIPPQVVLGWKLKDYFMNYASVSTQEIRQINRINRKIWAEALQDILKELEKTDKYLTKHIWLKSLPEGLAWASTDKPEEAIENVKKAVQRYIMPPSENSQFDSFYDRLMSARRILRHPEIFPMARRFITKTHLVGTRARLEGLWIRFLEDLTRIEDPLVKYQAHIALARYYPRNSMEATKSCELALDVLLNDLNSPNEPVGDLEKWFLREDIEIAIVTSGYLNNPNDQIKILNKIYNPLLDKKDVKNIALWTSALRVSCRVTQVNDIETANSFARLFKRIIKVLEDSNDKSVVTELDKAKDRLAALRKKFPHLGMAEGLVRYQTTMLLKKSDWPKKIRKFQYIRVCLVGDRLWIGFAEPGVGLAVVNLLDKKLLSLYQGDCNKGTIYFDNIKAKKLSGPITGMAIDKHKCYVAIRDVGLVKFPRSLKGGRRFLDPIKILTEKDGLPSVSITGMAKVGEDLWLAYGGIDKESGLIIYNPEIGDFETIFCSTLEGDPPFNSGKSYAISFLTPYLGDKLFFILGERGDHRKHNIIEHWWGLWKMDINSREAKLLWRDDNNPMVLEAIDNVGTTWWLRDIFSLVEFDPHLEKARFVLGRTYNSLMVKTILKPTIPMPELQKDPFVPESYLNDFELGHLGNGQISLRTSAVHGNKLWACLGRNQIIVIHKGKGHADAELFDNNILNGDKVLRFFSTPYGLIAIGEGTVGLIETGLSKPDIKEDK